MKKNILLYMLLAVTMTFKAQILLDNVYTTNAYNFRITKLHVNGYKYVKTSFPNMKIYLYNANHSLFKTINIPTLAYPITGDFAYYVSENLFDLDNLVEYAVFTYSNNIFRLYILKENGTILMQRDSATFNVSYGDIFHSVNGIFFDGTSTKMKLEIQSSPGAVIRTEIYTLPGSIPCIECSSTGTVTGIASPNNLDPDNAVFYPNPVTDQLKLKYKLPKDFKNAEIKIYDLKGKLIETYKVTDDFDFIYLPTDYNNGFYLYSLNVDGKTIKTEKIILDR